MQKNKGLGPLYESKAASYLSRKGYKIIAKNFSCRFGEVDIICSDGESTIFVEVKYRKNCNFGAPPEFVGSAKQAKIKKASLFYITYNNVSGNFRYDVISFIGNEIEHIEDAFN
jgi:putative endonuclease